MWPSTPASMVDYVSRAASAWLAFTGDKTPFHTQAVPLARYLLTNGTTPSSFLWASMPYASSDPGAHIYCGANSSLFGGCKPNISGCRGDGIGTANCNINANFVRFFYLKCRNNGELP